MGRGRAKAKQTKVARELKYFSPDTDLSALERELRSSNPSPGAAQTVSDDSADTDDDDGDYDKWASPDR